MVIAAEMAFELDDTVDGCLVVAAEIDFELDDPVGGCLVAAAEVAFELDGTVGLVVAVGTGSWLDLLLLVSLGGARMAGRLVVACANWG